MPLRTKLLLSMVIPALLLCAMGAISITSLRQLEQAAGRILSNNYRSIQAARDMSRQLRLLELAAAGQTTGPSDATRASRDFAEALHRGEANITEAGEVETLQRIRATWNRVGADMTAAIADTAAFDTLHTQIDALVLLNEQAMIAHEVQARVVARGMLGAVTITAVAAFLALAVFALVSAGRISRPVVEVADRLHQALNPESADVPLPRRRGAVDEIARLHDELDALLLRLTRYEDEQSSKLSHLQGLLVFVMNEVFEGLVLMDADHRILAANRVGRTIMSMPHGEGHRLEELQPREDVRRVLAPLMEGGFPTERDLGEVHFPVDGRDRVFRPRVLPVSAAHSGVEGYLILFWDVTEQRRFEESRRRFISMLSHQLKTPMTSLRMSVSLLQERVRNLAPSERELLDIVRDDCASLSTLVSDLIEAARELTPDLALRPRRMDIAGLLRSALRPLCPQAEEKGVTLIVPPEGAKILGIVDPVKFPWVVTNVVGNALRYTERGGRIEVAVRIRDGQPEVTVEDTGTGITRENLDRIFRPYVSLDREPSPGTHGLGLTIAKEIVEAHGGSIEARSVRGSGTTFLIRLPPKGVIQP